MTLYQTQDPYFHSRVDVTTCPQTGPDSVEKTYGRETPVHPEVTPRNWITSVPGHGTPVPWCFLWMDWCNDHERVFKRIKKGPEYGLKCREGEVQVSGGPRS